MDAQNISQAIDFVRNNPTFGTMDLIAHSLTGLFLSRQFNPKSSRLERTADTLAGGFSPDVDLITDGWIEHRGITHHPLASLALGFAYGIIRSSGNLVERLKDALYSPAFKIATLGSLGHITFDYLNTPEDHAVYFAALVAGFIYQYYHPKK